MTDAPDVAPRNSGTARGLLKRRSGGPSTRAGGGPSSAPWGSPTSFEEGFRILRSNLEVALADIERPVVIVTSSRADEGKTVVCTKLALSFAEAGQRVVLVDLDLRRATTHQWLRTHNEFGVSDVLLGQRPLRECLQTVDLGTPAGVGSPQSMYFLGTGPPVANPAELLGSARTARMLEGLARQSDLVLLDTPPVLPVADTLVIGRIASGAILVVESRTTALGAVIHSKDLLIRNQTRLLGVVMNKFQARDAKFAVGYYGSLGYGYGDNRARYGPDDRDATPVRPHGNGSSDDLDL